MTLRPTRLGLATCLGLATLLSLASGQVTVVRAASVNDMAPPYLMVRTLQTIQDKVINGDLDSVEMQRYLLGEIDNRLRTVDMAVFDDPRNVDAALIYAMSGGNPQTLDLLAERDIAGDFDNRVTSILRRYLSGRGATALKQLREVVPEYRFTRIGPYLELIGANALMEKDGEASLKFFDWARLEAPGSIIEEAALRRSLGITHMNGDAKRALPYARRYARRFMNSPYASQFADIFVSLAVEQQKALPPDEIKAVLSLIERKRQREIYLRLARRAAINGDRPLADFAAFEARRLSKPEDKSQLALAELYSGIVSIPGDGVNQVLQRLNGIPDLELSPKDRFLRDAAQVVAEEVVREPGDDSLRQVQRTMVDKEYRDMMSDRMAKVSPNASLDLAPLPVSLAGTSTLPMETRMQALDSRIGKIEDFVSTGRSKLKDIDALLSTESN